MPLWRILRLGAFVAAAALLAAQSPARAEPLSQLFQPWIDGTAPTEPAMQVQRYDADTYVFRQSIRTSFEAPFLYLLFGRDKALLLDTGAGGAPVRATVDGVIADWLAAHHRTSIPLVVAHSHGHGDHHGGDAQFADRPDTTVVGLTPQAVAAFFHIDNFPEQIVHYDLGKRVLDIIPTPGHHPAHIMVVDEKRRLLLAGDSLYPGVLTVQYGQFTAYRDSIDRVVAFTEPMHIKAILGAHIEMTTEPGKTFASGAKSHPGEHRLELPYTDLLRLQKIVHDEPVDKPVAHREDDFVVFPSPPPPPPRKTSP
jgi:glyoxylase-like metal-dependent hydrolase (beta-lactamase superfamily II)